MKFTEQNIKMCRMLSSIRQWAYLVLYHEGKLIMIVRKHE